MNIFIPDSWLREHLKTKATPHQIAEYLSLCSQSVEKTTKVGNDWVYEIEITTNRPDCLSVYGIARELAAILPRFNIDAKLKPLTISNTTEYEKYVKMKDGLPLTVKITNPNLCPRFTAIIFDQVKIGPSPKIIQERLEEAGIRALNNVVDISNYLMLELGQPMHTFDYDKIMGAKMILREATTREKITTLDGKTWILPEGAIVIEDGKGRIIDLCGIMGGENSAVSQKTKRVLLFVQTYDPTRIRRTCQQLAFRTEAASRFEKGVDPEGVIPAINKAIEMFKKNCGAKIASNLIDIYPHLPKQKIIKFDLSLINRIIGVEIPKKETENILKSLGFGLLQVTSCKLQVVVPHWRDGDIAIPEDLIEEIARLYGYHWLPSLLPPGRLGEQSNPRFLWEEKIKTALKYWGLTEVASYSMVGEELLINIGLAPQDYLKITNPLSADLVYMRPSLIPSLLQIIAQNQANSPEMKIFEMANIYIPQGEENLPEEIPMLTAALTGDKFFEAKGILEALFEELGIKNYQFAPFTSRAEIFNPGKITEILIGDKPVGILGEVNPAITHRFEISSKIVIFDLELNALIKHATQVKKYRPIPVYPATVEDLSFVILGKIEAGRIIETIKSLDRLVVGVRLLDAYNNTQTFRIIYQSPTKTLTSEEVAKVREKIIEVVKEKFGANLKT